MIELTTGDILKVDSDAIVGGAPQADKMQQNRNVPNMTAGRAALVELMGRYIRGLLDPTISLLEVHKAMAFLDSHPPTKVRLDRVDKLDDGFATTQANVVQRVHAWSERKQKFTSRQIGIALDVLADQGWINTAPALEYA